MTYYLLLKLNLYGIILIGDDINAKVGNGSR